MPPAPLRVAVGMSGGVDSSVAAVLLQEAGYKVIGLTMAIWDESLPVQCSGKSGCLGPGEREDIAAARAMAKHLQIEHHVIPLVEDYRREVLDPFRATCLAGRTPNPCALCNPRMKFDLLPGRARQQGCAFDLFATGHYVRRIRSADGTCRLLRGVDPSKDQSYFLARLQQSQLAETLFPLGNLTKAQVRDLAESRGLRSAAGRPESQDFFEGDDRGVLFEPGTVKPGPIVDTRGRRLGTHRGLIYYTVGQRQGLGIAAGKRVYVCALRADTNTLVVSEREDALCDGCMVEDMRWIAGTPPGNLDGLQAQLRYRHAPVTVRLQPSGKAGWQMNFDRPQFAVAPGQMAVLYDGDQVLGGGWIASPLPGSVSP